jgi:hypothetical protein
MNINICTYKMSYFALQNLAGYQTPFEKVKTKNTFKGVEVSIWLPVIDAIRTFFIQGGVV